MKRHIIINVKVEYLNELSVSFFFKEVKCVIECRYYIMDVKYNRKERLDI